MDGWVIIETDLNTKNFDKQLAQVEKELNQLQEKQKILQQYNIFNDKARENNPEAIIGWTKENVEELQKYGLTLEDIGNKDTWTKLASQIEVLSNKYVDLSQKNIFKNIEDETNKINLNIDKAVKKVGRWALAVFGVRGAYSFIRKAVSSVSQYNEQIGADINYMSMALASTLEPLVQKIVNLAHTLLVYIGYIVKAWTGKNIFANANKYLQKAVGSAKQLNKQLASFDEMNILSDSSGGSAGTSLPSFDLSKPEDVPIPSWLQWIAEHKDEVIPTLAGIAGGLGAIKLGIGGLKSLGIGIALDGIIGAFIEIKKFLNDPSFERFINILFRIGEAVVGIGIALESLPIAVAGIAIVIVALVLKNYDKIVGIFNNLLNWIYGPFRDNMIRIFGPFADIIIGAIARPIEVAKALFESFYGGIKRVIEGIVKMFKGDFKGGITDVFMGLKSIMLAPLNAFLQGINSLIRGINRIKIKAPSWLPLVGGKEVGFNIPQIPKLAKGGIVNMPGQGVSLGSAIVGERGREAVLPLQDSQILSEIADAIGKRITINANITNTMNGRVISRELQKVQNEDNFAFNR